jgi:hypothetical protein
MKKIKNIVIFIMKEIEILLNLKKILNINNNWDEKLEL